MRNEGQDCDYDKQKIKHYYRKYRWVGNEWVTKDKIVTTLNIQIKNLLLWMRNEGQDCDYDKQKIKHY